MFKNVKNEFYKKIYSFENNQTTCFSFRLKFQFE